jgi:peptide deformylase
MDHLKGVLFVDRVTDSGGLNKELKDHGFKADDVRSLI